MNVDGQPPRQPEELPGQVLGEFLELLADYVDERYTDAVVEERLRQFLLQREAEHLALARPAPTGPLVRDCPALSTRMVKGAKGEARLPLPPGRSREGRLWPTARRRAAPRRPRP